MNEEYADAVINLCKKEGLCLSCGKKIIVMAFKGTGFCSENCRDTVSPKRRKARQIDQIPTPQRKVQNYG